MCVRMKLSDFINTEYENDEINPNDLKKFLLKWENKLHFRTKVTQNSKVHHGEFIFYDIVPKGVTDNKRYRFKYEYTNNSQIVEGLNQLYACVKFITTDKPNKRQKRNDYED